MAKARRKRSAAPARPAPQDATPQDGASNELEALRLPPERQFADQLAALAAADLDPKPPGWRLSPKAIRSFICGSDEPPIPRKFFGDDVLVERAIIALASNRGLLLVGEPGTAKSMLSELLAAGISGCSTNTIQGAAGVTEDQIKYSWNYAMLLDKGPGPEAMVPAPVYVGLRDGVLVRFEEITRCPPEIQDALVSVLSDKVLVVPELEGDDRVLLARPGFNVIATANIRDRGVHEMSSALKRRFNFETVAPIGDRQLEVDLVARESARLLADAGAVVEVERDVIELLVTAFQDLRSGQTADGIQVDRPSTVMSTAEAVSVTMSAGLDAYYYDSGRLSARHIGRHLSTAALKDNAEDLKKLRHYLDVVVKSRADNDGGLWKELYEACQ